jgi:hypothetical protein
LFTFILTILIWSAIGEIPFFCYMWHRTADIRQCNLIVSPKRFVWVDWVMGLICGPLWLLSMLIMYGIYKFPSIYIINPNRFFKFLATRATKIENKVD